MRPIRRMTLRQRGLRGLALTLIGTSLTACGELTSPEDLMMGLVMIETPRAHYYVGWDDIDVIVINRSSTKLLTNHCKNPSLQRYVEGEWLTVSDPEWPTLCGLAVTFGVEPGRVAFFDRIPTDREWMESGTYRVRARFVEDRTFYSDPIELEVVPDPPF